MSPISVAWVRYISRFVSYLLGLVWIGLRLRRALLRQWYCCWYSRLFAMCLFGKGWGLELNSWVFTGVRCRWSAEWWLSLCIVALDATAAFAIRKFVVSFCQRSLDFPIYGSLLFVKGGLVVFDQLLWQRPWAFCEKRLLVVMIVCNSIIVKMICSRVSL